MTNLSAEMSGKRVELLKEALPQMTRIAAIANEGHPGWQVEFKATQAASRQLRSGCWSHMHSYRQRGSRTA